MELLRTMSGNRIIKYQSPSIDLSKEIYKSFSEDSLVEMEKMAKQEQSRFDFLSQFADFPEVSVYAFGNWDELLGIAYNNNLLVKLKASYTIFHEVRHIDSLVGYAINSDEYGIKLVLDSRYSLP